MNQIVECVGGPHDGQLVSRLLAGDVVEFSTGDKYAWNAVEEVFTWIPSAPSPTSS